MVLKNQKEGDNVVIKLDMAKEYDRVSWAFTCVVLRKMGLEKYSLMWCGEL